VLQVRPSGTARERAKVTIRLATMGDGTPRPVGRGWRMQGCGELHARVGAETYSRECCVTVQVFVARVPDSWWYCKVIATWM
jgi:hypothetical protein